MALDLDDAANAPKRTMIGGDTVEEHSLSDRIEYAKYLDQLQARDDAAAAGAGRSMLKRTRLTHERP
jgi:hypothetical protein